jgi:hypothetical protein
VLSVPVTVTLGAPSHGNISNYSFKNQCAASLAAGRVAPSSSLGGERHTAAPNRCGRLPGHCHHGGPQPPVSHHFPPTLKERAPLFSTLAFFLSHSLSMFFIFASSPSPLAFSSSLLACVRAGQCVPLCSYVLHICVTYVFLCVLCVTHMSYICVPPMSISFPQM